MTLQGYETPAEVFAEAWESSSWIDQSLVKRYIMSNLDVIRQNSTSFFSKLTALGDITTLKPQWMEAIEYPEKLVCTLSGSGTTLTVTGDIFNRTATRALMLQVARENAVLRYSTGGVVSLAQVSAVDASLPVLTVAATGGTSMPADGTLQEWTVVGEPFTDAEDADNPRMLTRKTRYCTTEIFSDTLQMLKTRMKLGMEVVGNELQHQLEELMNRMNRLQSRAVIQQYPVISAGEPVSGFGEERSRLCGLTWWPTYLFGSGKEWENAEILKDAGGVEIDKELLDNLAKAMWNNGTDFGQGNWQIWVNPVSKDYMHEIDMSRREMSRDDRGVGYLVDRIILKRAEKEFPIFADRHIPPDIALLLDMSKAGYGYFADDHINKEELPSGGRYKRWQISCQLYGVVIRKAPVSIGMLKNLKTS